MFVANNVFLNKKVKKTITTKQKIKHKNPCRSRGLNPRPLAPKANALPLHHRVNCSEFSELFCSQTTANVW